MKQTVPVIPVDDRQIIGFEGGLPIIQEHGGLEFVVNELAQVDSLKVYSDFAKRFATLSGPAIVLLDLQLGDVLDPEQMQELRDFSTTVRTAKNLAGGLYLLNLLLERQDWYGVVLITTDHTVRGVEKNLVREIICKRTAVGRESTGATPLVVEFRKEGSISAEKGSLTDAVKEAIELFLKATDPVAWYLFPSLEENDRTKVDHKPGWFEGQYHEAGRGFERHLNAVKSRYPTWKLDTWAKALMESAKRPANEERRRIERSAAQVPWVLLKDFLGEDLSSDLSCNAQICLPTQPAFPFLQAAREFFLAVRARIADRPVVLRKLTKVRHGKDDLTVLFLGVEHVGEDWSLWDKCWQTISNERAGKRDDGSGVGEAFLRALDARPRCCDESMVKEEPLGGVFDGLPGAAVPWVTPDRIGLSWEPPTINV